MSFDVRKYFRTKGRITFRGFVCTASGYHGIDKRNRKVKRRGAQIQTGCSVCLYLKS